MATTLIVPGLRGSGPTHWQSWFEARLPGSRRVVQDDWERTCLSDWAAKVRNRIDEADEPVWIVAHSFGCLASVTAAVARPDKILGTFLVAPADPDRFNEPHVLLEERLPCPSLVVASTNDPWVKYSVAERLARQWGSDFLNIGPLGHVNVDSGHGPWPEGLRLFEQWRKRNTSERQLDHLEISI